MLLEHVGEECPRVWDLAGNEFIYRGCLHAEGKPGRRFVPCSFVRGSGRGTGQPSPPAEAEELVLGNSTSAQLGAQSSPCPSRKPSRSPHQTILTWSAGPSAAQRCLL